MATSKTSTTSQSTSVRSASNYQGVDTRQNFTVINKFLGYRNREDKTKLPMEYMIPPSQNVLIDISGRLKSRQGYTLDGQANITITPIYAWHDWEEHKNSVINLRAYSGNLHFRYDNGITVAWTTIQSSLGTDHIRFTNYWDNTEKENVLLYVDGSTNVYKWNGAITTFASATTNTITKQGAGSWASEGFYISADKKVMLGGVEYTYTAGEGTTTLTGVSPDPTGGSQVVGDLIYQSVVTIANSAITDMDSSFKNDGIANVQNQIYYGSESSNEIYVSKQNDYKSVSFSTPVRLPGEGALMTLRALWNAFEPQEDVMYINAGLSQWYETNKVNGNDATTGQITEDFNVLPLKTSTNQGAIRQETVTHDRNSIVFLSNETRLLTLGRVEQIFTTPMLEDYSYPIANDMNNFDWTDSSVKYFKSYIYVFVPRESKVLILNQTDPNNVFWEAPQTGAFSGASIINGSLYLHSYTNPETYKWLDGYSDNTNPILCKAQFAYTDYNSKGLSKYFSEYWVDGYITPNTSIDLYYNFDLDGCTTLVKKTILGTGKNVCTIVSGGSLGKTSLGKHGLGTYTATPPNSLPPYFSLIKVSTRKDFFKFSPLLTSYGVDFHWEILSMGPLVTQTMYGNNTLKED